jgi:branched-chain amino acid transport system permease protein
MIVGANIPQLIVDGISLGCLYALVSLGIALIFGIMRLINFAHGELVMVGGFTMFFLAGEPWLVLVFGAVVMPAIAALAMERLAFRPLRDASAATLLISSFALSYLIQNVTILTLGSTPRSVELPTFVTESVQIGSVSTLKLNVVTLVVTAVLLVALAVFMKGTRLGVQMRAASEDFLMARLLGVRANKVIAAAFAISGILAGVVSLIFVAQTGSVTPTIGLELVLIGFVATIVGGLGSIAAAAAGGFFLGLAQVSLQVYLPLELRVFRDAFLYGLVILILLVRPQGLLVRGSGERIV